MRLSAQPPSPSPDAKDSWDWEFIESGLNLLTQPIATLLAGCIVGFGAWLGFVASSRTRQTMEDTAQLNHMREVLAARQERYTTIAGQLSDEKTAVRLAGVYALSALADEWHKAGQLEERDTCVKLLCACLRINSSTTDGGDEEVRRTVISMIQAHTLYGANPRWPGKILNLSNTNLRMASLQHCDLSDASFSYADLEGANLSKSNLTYCYFLKANMSRVSAISANFSHSIMDSAQILEAQLVDSSFHRTVLTYCEFQGANLAGVDLGGAAVAGADLREAQLWLDSSKFQTKLIDIDTNGSKPEVFIVKSGFKTEWPSEVDIKAVIHRQGVKIGIDSKLIEEQIDM